MDHRDLASSLRTVADACAVARSVQRAVGGLDRIKRITKDDRSPVTVADFAVQAIVAMDLAEHDADALIVGEEHTEALRRPEQAVILEAVIDAVRTVRPSAAPSDVVHAIDRCDHDGTASTYWALDPIDGTKGFLRGQQYAVALALLERGSVVLGVMGCPNLPINRNGSLAEADPSGAMYYATVGGGAWEIAPGDPGGDPRRIGAARHDGTRPVRVCESIEAAHSKHDDIERILDALGGGKESVRLDSQCKYAIVARGQADAYLRMPTRADYVERIWDHAAGSLIAAEAGAAVTDMTGARLDFSRGRRLETNRGIVCAAPALHERIIEAIGNLGLAATA